MMHESFWSIAGWILGAISGVGLILLVQKFRKKDDYLKEEGVLWSYFFLSLGGGGIVISSVYFVKVVFKQGTFPPRPEDALYGFMFIFALKMMVYSAIFIRKAREKYKQKQQDADDNGS